MFVKVPYAFVKATHTDSSNKTRRSWGSAKCRLTALVIPALVILGGIDGEAAPVRPGDFVIVTQSDARLYASEEGQDAHALDKGQALEVTHIGDTRIHVKVRRRYGAAQLRTPEIKVSSTALGTGR